MMSNYPPGVSGFEPEISGYDEREIEREVYCPEETCSEFESEVVVLCVEVETSRGYYTINGNRSWTCPACGTDHEEFDVELEDFND